MTADTDVGSPEQQAMVRAIELAESVRGTTSPNPWVGCVVLAAGGGRFDGATRPPGGSHAEIIALAAAGEAARGATLVVTLEPCPHHGRTGPCTDAVISAGIARVVVGIEDPDSHVRGSGLARLRAAGVDVEVGVGAAAVAEQLAPYVKHRRTGRPWVVLKLAVTADGHIAAADGTSRWITGESARADAHALRAQSDAVLVGAGTVRADDPALTVRLAGGQDPLRVVLGQAPARARVHPALELGGDVAAVLDTLGGKGVVQLLVEGGAGVAGQFHRAGLVDRYVLYLAPALLGGDDGRSMFAGPGARTMDDVWRGQLLSVEQLGDDVKLVLAPREEG